MTPVVVRNIPRVTPDIVSGLKEYGVDTVHEAMGRLGLMKSYMRPIYAGGRAAGNAVTVLAQPGDNWMLHVAIEQVRFGDLLVVAVSADNMDGMFGDLLATSLKAQGGAGLVIDTGCRDARALTEMGFPVWSRTISAKGAVKATLGPVNIPIVCAGAAVMPGDVIVADDDGIVVVAHKTAAATFAAANKRTANEDEKRRRLASGLLGLDMYAMRDSLAKAGIRYVETLDDI